MSSAPRTQPRSHARRLDLVRVADAMRPGVIACAPDTSLFAIASLMAAHHIHCVAVPDLDGDGDTRWGIVSDLDVIGAAAAGVAEDLTAGRIAGTEALTTSDRERLDRAVQLMCEHQASHLVVISATSGRPVGILSTLDVAAVLAAPDDGVAAR